MRAISQLHWTSLMSTCTPPPVWQRFMTWQNRSLLDQHLQPFYNNLHCVCEVALWIWSEYGLLNPPKLSVYHTSLQPSAEPYGCVNNLIQTAGTCYFLFKSLVTMSVCYSDAACLRRGGGSQSVNFNMSPNYYCHMNCHLFCWDVCLKFHIGDAIEIMAVSQAKASCHEMYNCLTVLLVELDSSRVLEGLIIDTMRFMSLTGPSGCLLLPLSVLLCFL